MVYWNTVGILLQVASTMGFLNFPLLLSLQLVLSPTALATICEDLYAAGGYDPSGSIPLNCAPFEGSETLHAIIFGCNSLNQDAPIPADGTVVQSFSQKCTAAIAEDTTYTCYEMAADTDYSTFEAAINSASITCSADDQVPTGPGYLYQQTNATYEYSGEDGGQQTGGPGTTDFEILRTAEAYYQVSLKEGTALEYNTPAEGETHDDMAGAAATDETGNNTSSTTEAGDNNSEPSSSSTSMFHGVFILMSSVTIVSLLVSSGDVVAF